MSSGLQTGQRPDLSAKLGLTMLPEAKYIQGSQVSTEPQLGDQPKPQYQAIENFFSARELGASGMRFRPPAWPSSWLRFTSRGYTGECMIVMGDRYEVLSGKFDSVEKVGTVYHPLPMPYEHFDVHLCRRPKVAACHKSGQSAKIGASFFPLCWSGSGLCAFRRGTVDLESGDLESGRTVRLR